MTRLAVILAFAALAAWLVVCRFHEAEQPLPVSEPPDDESWSW